MTDQIQLRPSEVVANYSSGDASMLVCYANLSARLPYQNAVYQADRMSLALPTREEASLLYKSGLLEKFNYYWVRRDSDGMNSAISGFNGEMIEAHESELVSAIFVRRIHIVEAD